ncbi:MAG: MBL fold metallo-hydrolase [Firmicutes bacterium]|nr:MBL fold metallo-hydrolase [Bacillota bacterium]
MTTVRDLEITVVMDNLSDGLLASGPEVDRYGLTGGASLSVPLVSEHGLSYFISWTAEGERHHLLLDFGLSAGGTRHNLEQLGLDPGRVEALVLSHGHFDHFGGLAALRPLLPAGIPFYAGADVFRHRYLVAGGVRADVGALDPGLVEGFRVELLEAPREVLPGAWLSGPIARTTPFETGSPYLLVETPAGVVADTFPGEQALAFPTPEGLVVISSCAHAGIVNTVRHLQAVTGVERVAAVLGGFHLSGAPRERVEATVDALAVLEPARLVPMHCTGLQAWQRFAERLPEATAVNAVGSRWRF